MKTLYEQIIDVDKIASSNSTENIAEIISFGKKEMMSSASQDTKRTLLLAIDIQNDFMEDIGSLAVQGSKGDVERLTRWIYKNIEHLTQIICSLDSHSIAQIFHAGWWTDENGNQPPPFTIITYEDVAKGKWLAVNGENARSLEYVKNLESKGQKQLCIWPYHCLEGTKGAKLESEFTKMIYYHSSARNSTPLLIPKGQNPFTEMYGIIKAEYDKDNYINQPVLDAIKMFDEIYIAGEASSHCVLASTEQILEFLSNNGYSTAHITILEDCMSPITGFEDITRLSFDRLRDKYGIKIQKSTEISL